MGSRITLAPSQRRFSQNRELAHRSAITVCDLMQAALFHMSNNKLELAVRTVWKTQVAYQQCRKAARYGVPREIDLVYRAGIAWTKDVRSYARFAQWSLAVVSAVEWQHRTPPPPRSTRKEEPR